MKLLSLLLLILAPVARLAAQDFPGDLTLHWLLIPGEEWQVAAEGFGFTDGPCTDAEGNVFFSDLKAPALYRLGFDGTKTKISDEGCSGLKLGPDGRLYGCQGSKKRLIALDPASGQVEVLAEKVDPNDLAITRKGYIYFTSTGTHEVIFVNAKTKETRVADTGIAGPNGIVLSPDEGTLAVSDYRGGNTWVFRVESDGALSAKAPYMTMRLPIDLKGEFKRQEPPPTLAASAGDGMAVDAVGRYFVTSALGTQVFDPTGRMCGVLPKPQAGQPLTNCVLAGPGHEYLYVTNGDKILRRKVMMKAKP